MGRLHLGAVVSEKGLTKDELMLQEPLLRPSTAADRFTRWIVIAIGVYSVLLVGFLNLVILKSPKAMDRAIFLMADGMILLWIIVGGSLTPLLRKLLVPQLTKIPIDWSAKGV